jgi:hypothetical protein
MTGSGREGRSYRMSGPQALFLRERVQILGRPNGIPAFGSLRWSCRRCRGV